MEGVTVWLWEFNRC